MQYSPIYEAFLISPSSLKAAALELKYIMRSARDLAGVSMDKRSQDGPLKPIDHLEKSVLDLAQVIGIDFGVRWGAELDLRNENEIQPAAPSSEEPRA